MNAHFVKILGIIGLLALAVTTQSFAQPLERLEEKRDDARERIKTIKKWKLVEALNLSEEQTTKVFPRLNDLENQRDAFQDQRRDKMQSLEVLLKDRKTTDDKLLAKIKEIEEFEAQQLQKELQLRDKVKEALTVEQQAKWVLFEAKFEDHLRKLVRDFKGPGGPGGPDKDKRRE